MTEAGPQPPYIPAPPPSPGHPDPTQQVQQSIQQVQQPAKLAQQGQQLVYLNWSHFKPEFSGKPEDAEVHLLKTNDWMNAHYFLENIKIQRFCVTLVGEARLWYESLTPINIEWQGIQNLFRQQDSKISNTREQLFLHGDIFTLMKRQKQ